MGRSLIQGRIAKMPQRADDDDDDDDADDDDLYIYNDVMHHVRLYITKISQFC